MTPWEWKPDFNPEVTIIRISDAHLSEALQVLFTFMQVLVSLKASRLQLVCQSETSVPDLREPNKQVCSDLWRCCSGEHTGICLSHFSSSPRNTSRLSPLTCWRCGDCSHQFSIFSSDTGSTQTYVSLSDSAELQRRSPTPAEMKSSAPRGALRRWQSLSVQTCSHTNCGLFVGGSWSSCCGFTLLLALVYQADPQKAVGNSKVLFLAVRRLHPEEKRVMMTSSDSALCTWAVEAERFILCSWTCIMQRRRLQVHSQDLVCEYWSGSLTETDLHGPNASDFSDWHKTGLI